MSSVAQLEAEIYIGRGVFLKKIINPIFFKISINLSHITYSDLMRAPPECSNIRAPHKLAMRILLFFYVLCCSIRSRNIHREGGVFRKIYKSCFFLRYQKILKILKIAYPKKHIFQISSWSHKNWVSYCISKTIPNSAPNHPSRFYTRFPCFSDKKLSHLRVQNNFCFFIAVWFFLPLLKYSAFLRKQ